MILGVFLGFAVMAYITSVVCENSADAADALDPEELDEPHLTGFSKEDLWLGDTDENSFLPHERRTPRAAVRAERRAFLFAMNNRPDDWVGNRQSKSHDPF